MLLEDPKLLEKLNHEVREAMGMDVSALPAAGKNTPSANGNGAAAEPKQKEKAKK